MFEVEHEFSSKIKSGFSPRNDALPITKHPRVDKSYLKSGRIVKPQINERYVQQKVCS